MMAYFCFRNTAMSSKKKGIAKQSASTANEVKEDESGNKSVAVLPDSEKRNQEASGSSAALALSGSNKQEMLEMIRKFHLLQSTTTTTAPRSADEARHHEYKFWKNEPVPRLDEKPSENTFIEPNKPMEQLRKEPYQLAPLYCWGDVDVLKDDELTELYTLLTENYVEDDENMFRFNYSREFLRWALLAPNWYKDWHCGIRSKNDNKLVAFISAVPAHIRVYDKSVQMVEINFLCIHKQMRSQRFAPILIKEITRRVHLKGIFQATFTAGIVIPKPVGLCRYWHRSLNPKKLIETRFSPLTKNMTIQRYVKLYRLPEEPQIPGIKPMEKRHIPGAFELLTNYLTKFDLAPVFEIKEFEHFFLPQANVIYTYVVEEVSGKVTDLLSFYCLPSSVMHHHYHKMINAAYSFYNVATTVPLLKLMNDALILAKKENFDVFNALDLMENKAFLEQLKFGIGDGNLQYYLYNWKCPDLQPERIGLVLQ